MTIDRQTFAAAIDGLLSGRLRIGRRERIINSFFDPGDVLFEMAFVDERVDSALARRVTAQLGRLEESFVTYRDISRVVLLRAPTLGMVETAEERSPPRRAKPRGEAAVRKPAKKRGRPLKIKAAV